MAILVSGAAGLIGGELVARLAGAGHAVLALVHRRQEIRANSGALIAAAPWTGSVPAAGTVATVTADLSRPGLGLDAARRAALARQATLVVHCAAVTAFDAAPETYRMVNVAGTRALLALAPDRPFLHISTAYVCGLKEGAIAEAPRDPGYGFGNGYEASKAEAEALVLAAIAQGRAAAIARPSIVVGDHATGTIRSFDTIYAAFRAIAGGRLATLPARPDALLDLVPICHVTAGLHDMIAGFGQVAGKIVHLVGNLPVRLDSWLAAVARVPALRAPALIDPAAFDPAGLPPAARRIHARSIAPYARYLTARPRFEASALRALSGRHCPPLDDAALDRMIAYCVDHGLFGRRQRMSG